MSNPGDDEIPINLKGPPPDPANYDGPLNVFIELHGTAVANNTATQTLLDYEKLHPQPPAVTGLRPPEEEPPPPAPVAPEPIGKPIPAGRRVEYRGVSVTVPISQPRWRRPDKT